MKVSLESILQRRIFMHPFQISAEDFNPKVLFQYKSHVKPRPISHSHDFLSTHYVVSGHCMFEVDGKEYLVKKDDVIIINPGVSHHSIPIEGTDCVIFYLGIDELYIKGYPKNFIPINSTIISIRKYIHELYNCYHNIVSVQEKKETLCALMAKELSLQFLVILLKELSPQATNNLSDYFHLETYDKATIAQTITNYFHENYMKKISIEEIAKSTYLSTTYITKIYKEITGDTPINYLINLRMEKAREILSEGHFSIQTVAKRVGYDDPYYFSKLFKKKFGYSPSTFKSQAREMAASSKA